MRSGRSRSTGLQTGPMIPSPVCLVLRAGAIAIDHPIRFETYRFAFGTPAIRQKIDGPLTVVCVN